MSKTGDEAILAIFKAAVAAYAEGDWDTLESFYDDHIVLKLPDSSKAPISGKSNVINFLSGEARDHPTFTPAPDPQKPIVPHDVDDAVGFITHTGTWKDDNHGTRPIRYVFGFINRGSSTNPNWKFLLLWSNN